MLWNLRFTFNGERLEIVKSFSYLGVVFSSGGSFNITEDTLAGKAQKAIYKLDKYLYNFPSVSVKHRLNLFDKLILPILNYSSEVWGFHKANNMCITCNTIEDEYHFVIECSIFTGHRKQYISKCYWTNPSMYRLKQLFDCTNVSKLRKYTTPFIKISYNCCIPVIMYIYIIN